MKIDKIEITIAAPACLGYDDERDTETDAYLESYAESVADAVTEKYPDAKIECELDWRAPANKISIDGDIDYIEDGKALDAVEENVRYIWQDLWNNPDKWWHRNSEFHHNA